MYFPVMPVLQTLLLNLCELVITTFDIIKKKLVMGLQLELVC